MYVKPKIDKTSFTCPICGVLTQQNWWHTRWGIGGIRNDKFLKLHIDDKISVSTCIGCGENTLWANGKMLHPDTGTAPTPNEDMPGNVKSIYLEAASIYSKSPRGAAALLRLGIQVLCKELGGKGKKIDDDIAFLVVNGLPTIVQQSLDSIRVIGNEAVHPGQIDTDDPEVVMRLFESLNIIIQYMITLPNQTAKLYGSLPQGKLDYIEKRDNKS